MMNSCFSFHESDSDDAFTLSLDIVGIVLLFQDCENHH